MNEDYPTQYNFLQDNDGLNQSVDQNLVFVPPEIKEFVDNSGYYSKEDQQRFVSVPPTNSAVTSKQNFSYL